AIAPNWGGSTGQNWPALYSNGSEPVITSVTVSGVSTTTSEMVTSNCRMRRPVGSLLIETLSSRLGLSLLRACRYTDGPHAVHLHDEGAGENPPARFASPARHLALVSARREDRRARSERRWKKFAAQDHGG